MKDFYEDEELDLTGLHIEDDDEYKYMDFYRYDGKDSDYNYIKRKYEPNYNKSGDYISLYKDNYSEKLGYYYLTSILSIKPTYKYPGYTIYGELLEFGFVNNNLDEVKFLLDNMFEYASKCNMKFIKVKTKEKSFEKFYELLRTYKHSEDEKHIYLAVKNTKPERYRYLKHYKNDKLTMKELYHLLGARFKVLKNTCELELPNDEKFVVNRKTRKVSYPKRFINLSNKLTTFSKEALDLMQVYSMSAYDYKDDIIDTNYHINGFNYTVVKAGSEILAGREVKYIENSYEKKDNFMDFVIKAHDEHGIRVLHVCEGSKFYVKSIWSTCSKEWNYLPSIIEEYKNPKPKTKGPFGKYFIDDDE